MADVHSKQVRSYNMSRIRGKDTTPEILVRKFLYSKGLRYRLHDRSLPGRPDIVFRERRVVIFIQGCFWHGHRGCKYFTIPKTRTEWWTKKILSNRARDGRNMEKLIKSGWRVIEIFECELKKNNTDKTLNEIFSQVH